MFIVTLSKVLLFSLDVLSSCETMDDYKDTVGVCWCVYKHFHASFSSCASQSVRTYWEFHPVELVILLLPPCTWKDAFVIRQIFRFPPVFFLWSVNHPYSWRHGDMVALFRRAIVVVFCGFCHSIICWFYYNRWWWDDSCDMLVCVESSVYCTVLNGEKLIESR